MGGSCIRCIIRRLRERRGAGLRAALIDLISARLAGLSDEELLTARLLALGEPLAAGTLARITATAALSGLEDKGLAIAHAAAAGDGEAQLPIPPTRRSCGPPRRRCGRAACPGPLQPLLVTMAVTTMGWRGPENSSRATCLARLAGPGVSAASVHAYARDRRPSVFQEALRIQASSPQCNSPGHMARSALCPGLAPGIQGHC